MNEKYTNSNKISKFSKNNYKLQKIFLKHTKKFLKNHKITKSLKPKKIASWGNNFQCFLILFKN